MEIIEIPFAKKVGVEKKKDGVFWLNFDESNKNHLKTMHASALFTLAESASGDALQWQFPELVGRAVPVLRDSHIQFKKPASSHVLAMPSIRDESITKFKEQFKRKGRSSIAVEVIVKDLENIAICIGTFNWFVQSIEQ